MAETPRDPETPRAPEARGRWWWWWWFPLGVLGGSGPRRSVLVLAARYYYHEDSPDSFASAFAKGVLLNGVVVAVLGAVVAAVLSWAAAVRAWHAANAEKRLGLFRRMRDAHLRVVLVQQVLRAWRGPEAYHEQMHTLQQTVKDMEEIREEVNVSGRLYDKPDRRMIMKGIDELGIYLHVGVTEYLDWCRTGEPPKTPEKRPDGKGTRLGR